VEATERVLKPSFTMIAIQSVLLFILYAQAGSAIRCFQCIYSEIEGDPSTITCADPFNKYDRGSIPVPKECDDTLQDETIEVEQDPRCAEARNKLWTLPSYCILPLNKTYTHCRTMWITINTIRSRPLRIVRSCATDRAEKAGKLHYYTGSQDSSTEVYTCNYDDCNGGMNPVPNSFLLLLPIIFVLIS